MPRPRKPCWNEANGCFRTRIDGVYVRFPRSIGRHDRPQVAGIPKAAWYYLAQLERRQAGDAGAATDPPVWYLIELYLQWAESERDAGRLSEGQLVGHASHLKLFVDHPGVGDLKARQLDIAVMDDFFDALRGAVSPRTRRPYSVHYLANVGKSVRAMLNWAARPVKGRTPTRLLADNPLRGYRFPRPPGAVRGYIEPGLVRRFLRWAWGRARQLPPTHLMRRFDRLFVLMLQFQRLTGCRPGEACRLEWSEVEWSARKVIIPPEKQKTGRKTHKPRVIHLTPPVERLLHAIEVLPGRHPRFVFAHRRVNGAVDRGQADAIAGEPWPDGSSASKKVKEWRDEAIAAGLPLDEVGPKKMVAYVNRHAYISNAINSGLTHEQAARLVGNTAQVIAQVYAHSIDEADAERARLLVGRWRSGGAK